MAFLGQSCIINDNRKPFLQAALRHYFEQDYIAFIHVVIPQIEEAIRNLLEMNGGVIYVSKNGAFQLKTFDTVLREPIVADTMGENLTDYFRIFLTDSKGLNLRNDLCHGLLDPEDFNQQNADCLLHALLCLGLIRRPVANDD